MSTETTDGETGDNIRRRPTGSFANRLLAKALGDRGLTTESNGDKTVDVTGLVPKDIIQAEGKNQELTASHR